MLVGKCQMYQDQNAEKLLLCLLQDGSELVGEPLDEKYITFSSQGAERRVPALVSEWDMILEVQS